MAKPQTHTLQNTKTNFQNHGLEIFQANFASPQITQAIQDSYTSISKNTPLPHLDQPRLAQAPVFLSHSAHFQGNWKKDYSVELTRPEKFWIQPGQSVQVEMMRDHSEENEKLYKDYVYHFIDAPDLQILRTFGKSFSMQWFLPAQHSSITEQLESLDYTGYLDELSGDFYEQYSKIPGSIFNYEYGNVTLPKLKLEQSKDLPDLLSELGQSQPENILTLSALFNEPTGIESGELRTRLEVDEKGVSADSSLEIFPLASDSKPFEFTANRPFYFTIHTWYSDDFRIHYMGVVMDPTQP